MPQKGLSMRKIREVLRLGYHLGPLQHEIARSCVSASLQSIATWNEFLPRVWVGLFRMTGSWTNYLSSLVQRGGGTPRVRRAPVNFAELHRQLQSNKYVTLQLLWEEYQQSQPQGYHYSHFRELYRHWQRKQDVVLRRSIVPEKRVRRRKALIETKLLL